MRILFWFRHDLRVHDNTGLHAACRAGEVIPCLCLDDFFLKNNAAIGPNRVALFLRAAADLAVTIGKLGGRLIVRHGKPEEELPRLLKEAHAGALYANRDYEPYAIERDRKVARAIEKAGGRFESFKDLVVFEGHEILTLAGRPYTIYTQYKNNWLQQEAVPPVLPAPAKISFPKECSGLASKVINADMVQPESDLPVVTEAVGREQLKTFLKSAVLEYVPHRDLPALEGTSHLSSHLKYGTLSPRTVVADARKALAACRSEGSRKSVATFISEIVWRDFFFQIMAAFPHVARGAFRKQYDAIRWEKNEARLKAWKDGRTGYPIVDAGMRQLRKTGWMHNRVRMITASFLCKDLLLDWRLGEEHFSRLLIDGEFAVNNGNWQWAAGTGTDAQPYFRIFNPVSQGERFDPQGVYVKRWVPELRHLDADTIHSPWDVALMCPEYPAPIVQHDVQRKKALELYRAARGTVAGESEREE